MCTLTYLPKLHSGYFLTSNRDEHINRGAAIVPKVYKHGDKNILYTKDAKAGGTWLAAADNGFAVCLLNGAFVKHFPEPPYRQSRGLVLLDFFDFNDVNLFAQLYNFKGIEPFTLVVFSNQRTINELVWDGSILHQKSLDGNLPHIWSSATLYDLDIRQKREVIFTEFIRKHEVVNVPNLLQFHHFSSSNDANPSIKMAQNLNGVQTISVTCIESNHDNFCLQHEDLLNNISNSTQLIKISSVIQA
jgi:hypothetical protein